MTDVIIALLPCIFMTWVAYGFTPIIVILVLVGSALLTEYLFNALFRKNTRSLDDGSSIITGILLAFTIGPFTPLPIAVAGAALAVIFGKMLWGGIGSNRFNPALVGREFMVILFPVVMNSTEIWRDEKFINISKITIFDSTFWDRLFFWPTGAMGEYTPFFLIIGGLYLLWRHRISWHIPASMIVAFSVMLILFREQHINFTLGGLLLGAIYMATDMPTSSSTRFGKIYFGTMIGILAVIALIFGAQRGYLSYAILIMNAFVVPINWIFRPRTWGRERHFSTRLWQGILLTLAILACIFGVLWLHHHEYLSYILLIFVVYSIWQGWLAYKKK